MTASPVDRWLRWLGHELMRSPERTRAESLVKCAREHLGNDRELARCVVAELIVELRGRTRRNRWAEELARAIYDRLAGGMV